MNCGVDLFKVYLRERLWNLLGRSSFWRKKELSTNSGLVTKLYCSRAGGILSMAWRAAHTDSGCNSAPTGLLSATYGEHIEMERVALN